MSVRDFAVPTEIETAFHTARVTILQARDLEMSFSSIFSPTVYRTRDLNNYLKST